MLRLAVATRAETFERMRDPLAKRDIEVAHVRNRERTIPLTEPWPTDYDVGFVFPPRPMEGGAVDALLSVPWVNDREAVLTSRNKAGVYAALSAGGVPVPETTMVSNPADEDDLLAALSAFDGFGGAGADSGETDGGGEDDRGGDADGRNGNADGRGERGRDGNGRDGNGRDARAIVVKPNSTTRGVGVAKVSDADSLLGVVDYLDLVHDFPATGDRSFLLQEYLPDARDYRAMVVDGDCVGGVERRLSDAALAEGRWKHNVHRGAEAVGVDLPAPHRRIAERTAEVLDIPYLGVDLLETDDRLVVNETNARPTIDAVTKYEPDFYDRLAALIRATADGGSAEDQTSSES